MCHAKYDSLNLALRGAKKVARARATLFIQLACGERLSQGTLYLDSVSGFKDRIRGLTLINLLQVVFACGEQPVGIALGDRNFRGSCA
jgi:hypothetical protein